jgi:hypothetical protein
MGRWKMVIGSKLKARIFPNQKTEARIRTNILSVSKGQREPHAQPYVPASLPPVPQPTSWCSLCIRNN